MRRQPGENMMRVLPDGFGNNERRSRINVLKYFQAFSLRINEAVLGFGIVGVCTHQFVTLGSKRRGECDLHFLLGWPANLIGRKAQVTAGDELDLVLLELWKTGFGGFHL